MRAARRALTWPCCCCCYRPALQGIAGEYGVTKNHSPVISELKAGVVQIIHEPVSAAHTGAC